MKDLLFVVFQFPAVFGWKTGSDADGRAFQQLTFTTFLQSLQLVLCNGLFHRLSACSLHFINTNHIPPHKPKHLAILPVFSAG